MATPNINEWFFLLMPAREGRSHNTTVSKLTLAPLYMKGALPHKKYFKSFSGEGLGAAGSINSCLKDLNEYVEKNGIEHEGKARVFILYDSVRINSEVETIALDLVRAEQRQINLIADYKSNWDGKAFHMIGKPYGEKYVFLEDAEMKDLTDFKEMPEGYIAGLGCYYGDMPLGYKFHYNTDDIYSEDISFFRDNKIRWYFWNIDTERKKGFWI